MLSSTPARRRTQGERRSEAEDALLAAAIRLFAANGIDQTSLAQIGEEAGYSRGLVNHHFGSKAGLVERLAKRMQDDIGKRLEGHGAGHEADTLAALLRTYLGSIGTRSAAARAFYVMWGASFTADSALRPLFAEYDAEFRQVIEGVVHAGQRHGSIAKAVDAEQFAVAYVGMLRGVAAQFVVAPDRVDIDDVCVTVERFVRASLA